VEGGGATQDAPDPSLNAQIRPNPDVVSREVGDEVVLVHLHTNQIYTLNRTAARLWQLLAEGRGLDAARQELLQEFDVDEEELRAEVSKLVGELSAKGLVEEHGAS
jgi:hypothetical protein